MPRRKPLARADFHVTRVNGGEVLGHPTHECVLHFAQGMTTGCASTDERLIGFTVVASHETRADVWWNALRAHPRAHELEVAVEAGLVAPEDLAVLKALPGWSDGLLVV